MSKGLKWLERSKDLRKRESQLRRATPVTVEFTGGEVEQILQAMMLNRRMLSRSPEHDVLDRALTLVAQKTRMALAATPEGQELAEEQKKLSQDFHETWPKEQP